MHPDVLIDRLESLLGPIKPHTREAIEAVMSDWAEDAAGNNEDAVWTAVYNKIHAGMSELMMTVIQDTEMCSHCRVRASDAVQESRYKMTSVEID